MHSVHAHAYASNLQIKGISTCIEIMMAYSVIMHIGE